MAKTISQDATFNIALDLVPTAQTNCTSNGSVVVNAVNLTRLGANSSTNGTLATILGVYDLELFNSNNVSITTVSTDTDLQGLAAGTYYIQATHKTYLCESLQKQFVIDESIVYPTVTGESITQNSSCTASGNGSITVTLAPASHSFTVDWKEGQLPTSGAATGTATNPGGANVFTLSDLSDGFYTGVVTDVTSGCTMNFTYELGDSLSYPVVNIPADQIVANTLCSSPSNGSITLNASDITINSIAQTDLSLFTWRVFSQNGSDIDGNGADYNPTFPAATSTTTWSNLSADTYKFELSLTSTGCVGVALEVIILDNSIDPVIDSLYVNPDANCSGTVALGEIEILTLDGNTPPTANYTYQWYVGASAAAGSEVNVSLPTVTDTNARIEDLPEGTYTVEITNNTTGCISTQSVQVGNDPDYPDINVDQRNNNLTCLTPGNGSFEILEVLYQGVELDSISLNTDYEAVWYAADGTTLITDADPSTPFQLDSLSAGDYVASIRRTDSNCESDKGAFTIVDKPFIPVVNIALISADSTCSITGTIANASIVAIADNNTNPIGYTFSWKDESGVEISTNDTLSSVYAGTYEVTVTNTSVGCTSSAAKFIIENAPELLQIMAVDSANITTCVPSDGFFEVTQMNKGVLSDYTFTFYNVDPTVGNPTPIQTGASPILSAATGFNVTPGSYYVGATSIATGCSSKFYQVVLEDLSQAPDVELVSFTLQMNCDPTNPNGAFSVTADGSDDTALYTFEWIADADGSVIETNNPVVTGLAAGSYTVNVTEVATGCMQSKTIPMINDLLDKSKSEDLLSTSSTANTVCYNSELIPIISFNGQASVRLNLSKDEFGFKRKKSDRLRTTIGMRVSLRLASLSLIIHRL